MLTVLKRRDTLRLVLLGKITKFESSLVLGRENPIAMIFRFGHGHSPSTQHPYELANQLQKP
jgi:hypothetical protein